MNKNTDNDGTKAYSIRRTKSSIRYIDSAKFCNDDIKVFVLCRDEDNKRVKEMEKTLATKKIVFINGWDDTEYAYSPGVDITNIFDYIILVISEEFLQDLNLLENLIDIYKINGKNEKLIPMIIWKDLYEPEAKAEVANKLTERIQKYKNKNFDDDFDGEPAYQLQKMQKIRKLINPFMNFATERDKKGRKKMAQKLLDYIKFDRKMEVADKADNAIYSNMGTTININDGQLNMANGNATINANMNMEKDEKTI